MWNVWQACKPYVIGFNVCVNMGTQYVICVVRFCPGCFLVALCFLNPERWTVITGGDGRVRHLANVRWSKTAHKRRRCRGVSCLVPRYDWSSGGFFNFVHLAGSGMKTVWNFSRWPFLRSLDFTIYFLDGWKLPVNLFKMEINWRFINVDVIGAVSITTFSARRGRSKL